MEKNKWIFKDNEISKILKNFYVSIKIINRDSVVICKLDILDSYMDKATFYFNSLEEAVMFVDNVLVNYNYSTDVSSYFDEQIKKLKQ